MNVTLTPEQEAELRRRARHMGVTAQALAGAYVRDRLRKADTTVRAQGMVSNAWPSDDWWDD